MDQILRGWYRSNRWIEPHNKYFSYFFHQKYPPTLYGYVFPHINGLEPFTGTIYIVFNQWCGHIVLVEGINLEIHPKPVKMSIRMCYSDVLNNVPLNYKTFQRWEIRRTYLLGGFLGQGNRIRAPNSYRSNRSFDIGWYIRYLKAWERLLGSPRRVGMHRKQNARSVSSPWLLKTQFCTFSLIISVGT